MYAKKFGSIEDAWRMFNKIIHAATLRYIHLECHDIGTCEVQARPESTGTKCNTNVCDQITLTFAEVLNAYVSIVVVEEGRCAHEQITGWIITPALLTFLAILAIYRRQRI
jgi:hypothetical protein